MRQIVQWLNIKIPYRQLKPEKEEELMTQLIDSNLRKKLTNSIISKLHFNPNKYIILKLILGKLY